MFQSSEAHMFSVTNDYDRFLINDIFSICTEPNNFSSNPEDSR